MFKYIIIAAIVIVGIVVYTLFAPASSPPPTVYYNNSGLWILSPVKINGTEYKSVRLVVENMSVVTGIVSGSRRYTYVVGYSMRYLYYDGVSGYAIVEVKNLGNATLYFNHMPIRTSAVVRLSNPSLPPPPTVNMTSAVIQCTPSGCQLGLRIRLSAPYGGRTQVKFITPSDVKTITVQFNDTLLTSATVPYGSRIELSTPWGSTVMEVRPNITAWIGGYNLTCKADSCYYTARVYVSAEVPAQVRIVGPNKVYDLSLFKIVSGTVSETIATEKTYVDVELPPGDVCLYVLPTGQSLCLSLPYEPPRLVAEGVRWVYYSPTDVLAVLQIYNPGYVTYRSGVYCDNCGPPDGDQLTVLQTMAYGATPLSRTIELRPMAHMTISLRVASSGGALVLLANNTRYPLLPPPLPRVRYTYNISIVPGSPPGVNLWGWTITRYAVVSIKFDRPDVVYKNFVTAYAGNMTFPVACSGQICVAYIPLEAVKTWAYASPPNGWRMVNSTAWPAAAYVVTPWGIIRAQT